MPRDSSGNYTLPGAYNPVTSGTTILAAWANTTMPDVATGLTDSLDRSGRGSMLAPFKSIDGSVALPGITFGSETTTGLSRPTGGALAVSVLGTEIARFLSASMGVGRTPSGAAVIDAQSDAIGIIRVRGGSGANQGAAFYGASGSDTTRFAFGQVARILGGTPGDDNVIYSAGYLAFTAGGSTERMRIGAAGNVTVNAPSSGVTQTLNVSTGGTPLSLTDGTVTAQVTFAGTTARIGSTSAHSVELMTGGTPRLTASSAGNVTFAAPSSGDTLAISGVAGGRLLNLSAALSGSQSIFRLENSSNTANSEALALIVVGGASAGDPYLRFNVNGATDWSLGIDNSVSDWFKISQSGGLGSADKLILTGGGLLVVNGSTPFISVSVDGSTTPAYFDWDTTNMRLVSGGGITLNTNGSLTAKMTIDTAGRIGVGTVPTGARFAIAGDNEPLRVLHDSAFIGFWNTAGAVRNGYLQFSASGNYFWGENNVDWILGTNAIERLRVTSDGRFYGKNLHNNAGAVTGTANQYIASGTWTPAATNVLNVSSTSVGAFQWVRVGNVVHFSGKITPTCSSGGVFSEVGLSLPIASNFTADGHCSGGGGIAASVNGVAVRADATNDRIDVIFIAPSASTHEIFLAGSYVVL